MGSRAVSRMERRRASRSCKASFVALTSTWVLPAAAPRAVGHRIIVPAPWPRGRPPARLRLGSSVERCTRRRPLTRRPRPPARRGERDITLPLFGVRILRREQVDRGAEDHVHLPALRLQRQHAILEVQPFLVLEIEHLAGNEEGYPLRDDPHGMANGAVGRLGIERVVKRPPGKVAPVDADKLGAEQPEAEPPVRLLVRMDVQDEEVREEDRPARPDRFRAAPAAGLRRTWIASIAGADAGARRKVRPAGHSPAVLPTITPTRESRDEPTGGTAIGAMSHRRTYRILMWSRSPARSPSPAPSRQHRGRGRSARREQGRRSRRRANRGDDDRHPRRG